MDPSKIASLLSIAQGAVQGAQGMNLKKKADGAMPLDVDPNVSSYLSELEQKRQSMETGSAFAGAIGEVNANAAGTNNAIVRAGTGNAGQTIQGLLQSQAGANAGVNQALAIGQNNMNNVDNQYLGLLNKVSARQMQLQLLRSQQLRAEWAKKMGAAEQNITTGAAGFLSKGGQSSEMPSEEGGGAGDLLNMANPSALGAAGGAGATGGGIASGTAASIAGTGASAGTAASLAGAGAGAGASTALLALSDRRAKENIVRVGQFKDGLGVYTYNYIGSQKPQLGVMADEIQELRPWALGPEINGFKTVNYAFL